MNKWLCFKRDAGVAALVLFCVLLFAGAMHLGLCRSEEGRRQRIIERGCQEHAVCWETLRNGRK